MLVKHNVSLDCLRELILFPDNGLWFLPVLFCIQMTYWLVMFVVRKFYPRERSLVLETVGSVLAIGVIFIFNKHNGVCSNIYFSYNLYAMFFIGSLVAAHLEKWLMHDVALLASVVTFSLLVPYFHMWGNNPSALIMTISISASVIMLHLSKAMESHVQKENRLVQFGMCSMTIYAAHFYLVQVAHGIKLDVTSLSFLPTFAILMLVAFVICHVCVAFGQIVGNNKILNMLLLGAKYRN